MSEFNNGLTTGDDNVIPFRRPNLTYPEMGSIPKEPSELIGFCYKFIARLMYCLNTEVILFPNAEDYIKDKNRVSNQFSFLVDYLNNIQQWRTQIVIIKILLRAAQGNIKDRRDIAFTEVGSVTGQLIEIDINLSDRHKTVTTNIETLKSILYAQSRSF